MRKKLTLFLCWNFLWLFGTSSGYGANYNPDAARTNAKLGLAYLKKGLYSASKDRLLTAISEDPEIASVWYSMAYYLEKTDNASAAEKYYQKAISVEPHSGDAKNNYGTFLCRSGQYQAGIKLFLAAAREPDYLDVAKAYENAGTCAMMIPDNKLASGYFQEALRNNPNLPFTLLSLARLSYQAGNESAAEKYFTDFKTLALNNKPANVVQQYHNYAFSGPLQRRKN